MLLGAIFPFRNKTKIRRSWQKESCLRTISEGIQSLVELIWMIMKNKTFVDLAFYMAFTVLILVTSSTQNIDFARKLHKGLKKNYFKKIINKSYSLMSHPFSCIITCPSLVYLLRLPLSLGTWLLPPPKKKKFRCALGVFAENFSGPGVSPGDHRSKSYCIAQVLHFKKFLTI